MFLPSGDQSSPPASVAIAVSLWTAGDCAGCAIEIGNPNLRATFFIREEGKALAVRRPARTVAVLIGDEDALLSPSLATGETPVAPLPLFSGTIQMCGVFLFAARSTSTALNSTHLPSGEGTGSPTRFSFIMSSKVKGCLAWAEKGKEKRTARNEQEEVNEDERSA